jgi:gliding motility-associated-like protein
MKLLYTIVLLVLPLCYVKGQSGNECPANIGFEYGSFQNWQCDTGSTAVANNTNVIKVIPSPPISGRHTLIPRSAATATDPYGKFPINPPDGSNYALKLGNDVNGAQAERVSYRFTVPANAANASLTYRYAVVFQDPGHAQNEQPRFIARMLDVQTNTYLPCASNEYIATASLPGFQPSSVDASVKYKTWSSVFINLGPYAGKTLELEFTTADCTRGAHWGYAYIDVGDCNVSASAEYLCKVNTASFTGPPGFQQYQWYNDNFTTLLGNGETLVLNPAPVIHTLHVIVIPYNGFGCSDTLDASIYPILPEAKAGPDTVICPGKPLTIGTPAMSGFSYAWSPPDNLSDSLTAMPVSTTMQPATYILTVTSIESGCVDKDTLNIAVFQPISVAASPNQAICPGQSVNLQATGDAVSYSWSPATGLSSATVFNPIATPRVTTTYQVTGFDGHACFTDTGSVTVTVYPKPAVDLGPDLVLSTGSMQPFSPVTQNGPIVLWQWSPADNLSCTTCANPAAEVKKNITYHATVTNEYGCTAMDSVSIKTFCLGSQVFIPNAFTPDGDGVNDILMVRGKGIALVRSFKIFSRWGELVFEKKNFQPNDPAFGWDGKIRGVTGPAEVYVYTAEVVCENNLINTYKGNTTLLK